MNTISSSFRARLGDKNHPGFLPQKERLAQVATGRNPFVSDHELPENSPAFFGRAYVMQEVLAAVCHPNKPRCVNLLGERRIGKSSLLNQLFAALGREAGLIAIHGGARGWHEYTPARFFAELHLTIHGALGEGDASDAPGDSHETTIGARPTEKPIDGFVDESFDELFTPGGGGPSPITDYPGLQAFIRRHAGRYRFVLILDEFETMADNSRFDAEFFANLHHLGGTPALRFGYLLASRGPLAELRKRYKTFDNSSLWNLFGLAHVLGLLQPGEGQALGRELWRRSLDGVALPLKIVNEIDSRAGDHPALRQMMLKGHWDARGGGAPLDADGIKRALWTYFGELWEDRSQAEKAVLVRILAGKPVTDHILLRDLRSRGLIIREERTDRLFTNLFQKFIRESLPGHPELSAILSEKAAGEDPESPAPRGNGMLGFVFKAADRIGLLRGAGQPKRN